MASPTERLATERLAAETPAGSAASKAANASAGVLPQTGVLPQASASFVSTPEVEVLAERCRTYLDVGYPVHLAGPAGTGKTTLALHLAARRGRPTVLIHGDDGLDAADLTGRDAGFHKSRLVDNYVRSVVRTEEEVRRQWVESPLTTACREGWTLVYDEFNRSRPEANNVLLSVFAEGVLPLPRSGRGPVKVHPEFRAVLTSNPAEYAGSHSAPDALLDRVVTVPVDLYDRETQVRITAARSGLERREAEIVVDVARLARPRREGAASLRAAIAVARVLVHRNARPHPEDPVFRWTCRDLLADAARSAAGRAGTSPGSAATPGRPDYAAVDRAIEEACAAHGRRTAVASPSPPFPVASREQSAPSEATPRPATPDAGDRPAVPPPEAEDGSPRPGHDPRRADAPHAAAPAPEAPAFTASGAWSRLEERDPAPAAETWRVVRHG